ncbi:MAG: hypothetical protein ACHQF0_05880 [Chitinophagales bacterium]
MKINKYFPFAFVYFFVNSLALPLGITYTAILAPFFYVWILLTRKKEIIFPFIALLSPFIIVQLLYGDIVRKVYFNSLLNLMLVYIFCQSVYIFLRNCRDIEKIFRKLLIINFLFCLGAIILYFTPWYQVMWIEQNLTEGVENFRRLKLFTYEASYYATLFVPLFCFYILQYFFRQNTIRGWFLLLMLFLPYVLSFSFGVIAALFVSGALVYILYFRPLTKKRRILNAIIFTATFLLLAVSIIYFFFRDSFFVVRLVNIFSGNDTSGKGRTSDAFFLANKLLQRRNEFWGIGLGQIKIIGETLLRKYYMYGGKFLATIPNAAAETLAIFGWAGLVLRVFLEIFFFFRTRVWTNYYRLWLFLFMFIYQFTGSFITNVAEYVIWILAFTNVFYQFDVKREQYFNSIQLPQRKVE